jgi:hypothetical protein
MHTITLSDAEQTLLIELLDVQLKELPHEIHHTDDHDYRQFLEEKERALTELLKKIKS